MGNADWMSYAWGLVVGGVLSALIGIGVGLLIGRILDGG